MAKERVQRPEEALRPLQLDPERAKRVDRPPYAIVDIGSNSIRLLVYDQFGRAPMPRFNEKSLARLAEGLAESSAIAPEHFRRAVEAVRRFRAIADAMGVSRIDAVATEAMRRASNGPMLAAAIEAESGLKVRILSGAEEARFATLGVISGFFRPVGVVGDMGGGSLEIAEAIDDHVGDRWVSLPLGALPVEAMMSAGFSAAKRQIDEILQRSLPKALAGPVFYPVGGGWRALAKAHMEAVAAPVKVVHGYTLSAGEARDFARAVSRLSSTKLAATPGVTERRARTLPAAALTLDRVLKHLKPDRVLFSALGLREGFLYSHLSQEEQYLDPLVEGAQLIGLPLARVPEFASELVPWTESLFFGETAAEKRLRLAVCALSDIAWRDAPDLRAEESFRRLLEFPFIGVTHPERVFIATAIHARYVGRPDAPWLSPAIKLLTPSERRRAQILGRAILLAYRFSGGVPAVLESARLRIDPDCIRLEVASAARAPDSEVVSERLKLLASAIGVKRSEVVDIDAPSPPLS
jgi:exopolyphosphatase / guanosine-5'-triphosphate,3'-diphosphate pyrophosphatase